MFNGVLIYKEIDFKNVEVCIIFFISIILLSEDETYIHTCHLYKYIILLSEYATYIHTCHSIFSMGVDISFSIRFPYSFTQFFRLRYINIYAVMYCYMSLNLVPGHIYNDFFYRTVTKRLLNSLFLSNVKIYELKNISS